MAAIALSTYDTETLLEALHIYLNAIHGTDHHTVSAFAVSLALKRDTILTPSYSLFTHIRLALMDYAFGSNVKLPNACRIESANEMLHLFPHHSVPVSIITIPSLPERKKA